MSDNNRPRSVEFEAVYTRARCAPRRGTMTEHKPPPQQALMNLIFGRTITQMVGAVAELGIADHLKDGPRTSDELARATATHAPSLYRMMRAMAMVGIFEEHDDHRFSLTPVGALL